MACSYDRVGRYAGYDYPTSLARKFSITGWWVAPFERVYDGSRRVGTVRGHSLEAGRMLTLHRGPLTGPREE